MIIGVGIDLVENSRFKSALSRQGERLLGKLFTPDERRYCEDKWNRIAHYAARFAVKEAVLKALGTGWSGGIRWTDVEVVHAPSGKAQARLTGRARDTARKLKIRTVHISITHTERYASAVAVAES
jgi:holo-[acyl-carrier protein] synthase